MALTTAQEITVFEILEVPYDDSVTVPVGDYRLTHLDYSASNTDAALQLRIQERLAALSSDEETKLITYITRWEEIGTCIASIEGDVGGVRGMMYHPDDELRRIQARVKVIIPVLRYIKEITLEANGSGGGGLSQMTIR